MFKETNRIANDSRERWDGQVGTGREMEKAAERRNNTETDKDRQRETDSKVRVEEGWDQGYEEPRGEETQKRTGIGLRMKYNKENESRRTQHSMHKKIQWYMVYDRHTCHETHRRMSTT